MTGKRPSCVDCGVTNFLHVIRVFCAICEPTLRCGGCHRSHRVHVGVVLVTKGPSGGPAYIRDSTRKVAS